MMAVTIARRARKSRGKHVRTKSANHPHHVGKRRIVPAPLGKGFVGTLREAEIGNMRKAFLNAVMLIGGKKFFGKCTVKLAPLELVRSIAAIR